MPVDQEQYYTCWSWTKTDVPVDQEEYYTCWSWIKTDVPLSTTLNGNRRGGNDATHTCHGRLRMSKQHRR